jgi:non-homologous end joining protein Ku
MLDEKSKGQDFTVAAPEASQRAQIIDLMHALKQSIEKRSPSKRPHLLSASGKTAS